MKKEISIPLTKVEDSVAANQRRDNYALTRDQQNSQFNEAIASRIEAEANIKVKCSSCGKEFLAKRSEEPVTLCPKCRKEE